MARRRPRLPEASIPEAANPGSGLCLISDCAHDSKIVGTIALRCSRCHAASVARGLAGNTFHGSSSAIRLIG